MTTATAGAEHNHERDYTDLLFAVSGSFAIVSDKPVYRTDADDLWGLYLDNLPALRQVHNCSTCRQFVKRFGGLVSIQHNGTTTSAMWRPKLVPDFYKAAFTAMADRVESARVVSVFRSPLPLWGDPITGPWSHMAVKQPDHMIYRERALTAGQAMAASKENFKNVSTALAELTAPMLDEGLRMLRADALSRSEKFIGPMQWLRDLHNRPRGRHGENVIWRAIAVAPEGYCHPRSSVIAPLLDDIQAGLPFDTIKARFEAKVHPLLYQRPQAAPSAGNIAAAEATVQKLGVARSLDRRFARLDDLLQMLWTPKAAPEEAPAGGVFSHIKPKDGPDTIRPVDMPPQTMTWAKFAGTVLETAEAIEMLVPDHGAFIALTTAVHADAPPILKWDRDDARNPVAWYVYPGGSHAAAWGLVPGRWAKVTGVTLLPTLWGSNPSDHLGAGAVLVLEGCVDRRSCGNALFPECLKDDLHGIRSTVEAYSRQAILTGRETASACGYDLRKGNPHIDCVVRVRAGAAWTSYKIDRWD